MKIWTIKKYPEEKIWINKSESPSEGIKWILWETISWSDITNKVKLKHSTWQHVEEKFYLLYSEGMPNNEEEYNWFIENCAFKSTKIYNYSSLADILKSEWYLDEKYNIISRKERWYNEILKELWYWKEETDLEFYKKLFTKIKKNSSIYDTIFEIIEEKTEFEDDWFWVDIYYSDEY